MRSWKTFVLGAGLALVAAWLVRGPGPATGAGAARAKVSPTREQLRLIHQKLDGIKQALAQTRAENLDLKIRVRALMHGLSALGSGRAVKPVRPRLADLPRPLPQLKPLPRE